MLERVLRVLEYPKITERLAEHASCTLGREKALDLKPSFSFTDVQEAQKMTDEGMTVLRLKGRAPLGGIRDIRASLTRAQIGGMLAASELLEIANTLYGGRQIKHFLEAMYEDVELPGLERLTDQITSFKELEQQILACIDQHGEVLDSASPALRQIRAQIRTFEQRSKEKLEQLLRTSSVQKMLQDQLITIRNGRYCIPIKAEYRSHFGGIVHDQSASGATLFVEPGAVVTINNQLKEAKLKEEKEIENILRQLSLAVGERADALFTNVHALAELDFIFAKAYFAQQLKAVRPKLNERGYFHLKKARHPLIPDEEIVPISFELGNEYTSIVITGPNTGGKTVTLKTLGLLTLMACSGLAVPAEEGTEIAVVSSIYADIGDEQSIEQSLSTFSSHMTNIVEILRHLDAGSLVLFDELGAGTDPTEGAALAMAILDDVYQRGARVVATTHYSELKEYAYSKPGAVNASVEFDVETLRPTYRLLVGVPGRSNAFSIAKRLGLAEKIIDRAKAQIGEDDSRIENMIASLEENRKGAEKAREEAERVRLEMERLRQQWQEKTERIEREKEKLLRQAEEEAKQYAAKIKAEAEEVIDKLRNMAVEQRAVKEHELIEAKKKLQTLAENDVSFRSSQDQRRRKKSGQRKFRLGEEVFVHSFGQKGHIVEQLSEQEYLVQVGIMKMNVERDQLEGIRQEEKKPIPKTVVKTEQKPAKYELDLRGQTIDEALITIDRYLDQAMMSGYQQVYIIHGKGTGQLRKGVQEFLKKHRQVQSTRLGGAGEGGSGVTVVELK